MTVALTKAVGDFVAGHAFRDVPNEVLTAIRNAFTDYAAVTILGRHAPVTNILRSITNVVPRGSGARVCFSVEGAAPADAALINGAAGHAHDYDDVGLDMHPAHPTVVMAPAILAEAEVLGRSGADIVAAYVAGYEVWGELAWRDNQPHHLKGWHPTGMFGAIAAAAAVANLRRLDPVRAAHAVAIAASQGSGVVANFGSMTKPFHAGHAAQAGVLSARLAENGLTGSADALESPKGFLYAVSPGGDVDLETPAFRRDPWWIVSHGLSFKLYPMCYGTHRSLDGMLALLREEPFAPEDVASIEVEMGRSQTVPLVSHRPKTPLEAKFSEEFAMAMAVIARRATPAELSDDFVGRDDVQALLAKVRVTILPGEDRPSSPPADRIVVTLTNGRKLTRKLDHPRGHPANPVDGEDLWTKFVDCVDGAMTPARARLLFERLQRIDELKSVDDLPLIDPVPQRQAS